MLTDKITDTLKNPSKIFAHFALNNDMKFVSDKFYVETFYKAAFGRKPDLENPKRFSEKLQWIKLYDRNPEYTVMVDKYEAKKWAGDIIGEEHIIPTIGIYDSFKEIDFDALPESFVIKCTHDSHSAVICKNKKTFDSSFAEKKLEKALKVNYYYNGRQWPYKNVKPRIIVENYIEDSVTKDLRDYKFFCFNGKPEIMYIATGRGTDETFGDFFDMNFNHLDLRIDHNTAPVTPEKPSSFNEMREMAVKLSKNIPHVRVDFYEVDGKVYFGEMTFFHCSGFASFKPDEWDEKLGSMIDLPVKK